MSAAMEWLERCYTEKGRGFSTGIAESCPECWKPIDSGEKEISDWTGLPACACGTVRGNSDLRIALHGLTEVAWEFNTEAKSKIAVMDAEKPD